ncbi:MAG: glycosyltransferase family 4 protein [Leptospirales bacterium]
MTEMKSPFRVLYLLTEPFITGGVQSDIKSLGPYFVQKGHEVIVACPEGDQVPVLSKAGVRHEPLDVHFRSVREFRDQTARLRQLIHKVKPTVIAPQSIRSSWLAHAAANDLPIRRITTIHNIHTPMNGLWAGFLLNYCSDLVIFESDHEYRRLTRLGLSSDKATVIPSGIDTNTFFPDAPSESLRATIPGLSTDSVVFGCVARMSREKAHSDLLQAFKYVSDSHPEAFLILVGDGPLKGDIVKLAESLGLSSRVHFAGQKSNIRDYVNLFDVFVLASRFRESLPRAAREAMACGKPIIATRMGALREVVEEGENGFLVPIGKPLHFARAMEQMIRDPEFRVKMGNKSYSLIQERFRLLMWLEGNEKVYQEAASKAEMS